MSTRELIAEFEVAGEPVSKSRARFTKRGSKTFAYTPEKTKNGERAIAWAYRATTTRKSSDNEMFAVEAEFRNGTRQRRDVDNMLKLILDGLNEIAWADDNQVVEVTGRKVWVNKAEAGTTVRIYSLGPLEPPTAECIRCGTPFRTYESWVNDPNGKKYCSKECVYTHRVERRQRKCAQCASDFLAWGETRETKFCSRECAQASGRAELACDHCAAKFTKQKSAVRAKNYCSSQCQVEAAKARRSTRFPGTCQDCSAGTTKKRYVRCASCKRAHEAANGRKP